MAKQEEANQEPSIEEILDSIRQIIADDEEAAPAAAVPAPAEDDKDDDVIELTERVSPPPPAPKKPAPPPIQVDMQEPEAAEEPEPEPVKFSLPPEPEKTIGLERDSESILTKRAEDSVMGALGELTRRSAIERGGEVTVEDIVREEVRPMLKEWLDRNLPPLVERLLKKEMDRISKRFEND